MKGRMSEHMKNHDAPPHAFAIEGSVAPLTWTPTCDVELNDADGDSTWNQKVFFTVPCSTATGGGETAGGRIQVLALVQRARAAAD